MKLSTARHKFAVREARETSSKLGLFIDEYSQLVTARLGRRRRPKPRPAIIPRIVHVLSKVDDPRQFVRVAGRLMSESFCKRAFGGLPYPPIEVIVSGKSIERYDKWTAKYTERGERLESEPDKIVRHVEDSAYVWDVILAGATDETRLMMIDSGRISEWFIGGREVALDLVLGGPTATQVQRRVSRAARVLLKDDVLRERVIAAANNGKEVAGG